MEQAASSPNLQPKELVGLSLVEVRAINFVETNVLSGSRNHVQLGEKPP